MSDQPKLDASEQPFVDTDVLVRLQEQTGDEDGELLQELVEVFVEDAKETCTRLAEMISAGPSEDLSREAHRLKSGAANLGAARMTALCKQLELIGATGDRAEIKGLITRLTDELPEVERQLRAYLERVGQAGASEALG